MKEKFPHIEKAERIFGTASKPDRNNSSGIVGYAKPAKREIKMEDYQERVIKEKEELDKRLERLTKFRHSNAHSDLNREERRLLGNQWRHMYFYSQVLADRIALFA